ncbi:hypothetical protein TNCV_3554231 [Trichonephila clavipes]|nr:hypothetical protein TNCV_3554231 [Trichonephila clavipes]
MEEFHCNCNVGTLREILGRPCVTGYHQRDDCRLPNDKSFCQRNSRNCGNESFGQLLSPTLCGRNSGFRISQVTDSGLMCPEFEPRATQNPPRGGGRCTLNLSRLKRLPNGVEWKLGEEARPSKGRGRKRKEGKDQRHGERSKEKHKQDGRMSEKRGGERKIAKGGWTVISRG